MFFPSARFGFTQMLEQHWETVLDECQSLPGEEFDPWPEKHLYNKGWDVYGLYVVQKRILENCIFCPRTVELLQAIPGMMTAGFSRMAAGTRIEPHVGYTDQVLRLHLALHASGECGIRVGAEVRQWIPGQCLIFDDTVEHEAWNRGQTDRLVLLVDFLKPQGWTSNE